MAFPNLYLVTGEAWDKPEVALTEREAVKWAFEYGSLRIWRVEGDVPPRDVTEDVALAYFEANPGEAFPDLFMQWEPVRDDSARSFRGALRP